MGSKQRLMALLRKHAGGFAPVVNFRAGKDRLAAFCFTRKNRSLTPEIFNDNPAFCRYIDKLLAESKARYGIGGYNELRAFYSRSELFNTRYSGGPRRLHLGTDIWGRAGEKVYAPLAGTVHSFGFNNQLGDYGATLILQHRLEGMKFHTLYGHCSKKDIEGLEPGMPVKKGQHIAHFGIPAENGWWPPHLHFQVIIDMGRNRGDYPGVCHAAEKSKFLCNGVPPDYVLQLNSYICTTAKTTKK